jgi:hypothetical protein
MTSLLRRLGWPALILAVLSAPASGQTTPPEHKWEHEWTHGTTLGLFLGAAVDSSKTASVAGGTVGWEITPSIALEGGGAWLDRGAGADAFAAALRVRAGLAGLHPAVPYLHAGVGFYRATFDRGRSPVPGFYRRRMTGNAGLGTDTFTDPSLVVGGGVNLFVSRHLAIRPDVEAMIVMRNSRSHVVTAATVHLAYHFEDHPVTPRVK